MVHYNYCVDISLLPMKLITSSAFDPLTLIHFTKKQKDIFSLGMKFLPPSNKLKFWRNVSLLLQISPWIFRKF